MKHGSTNLSSATWLLTGVALGALAMFVMDPVQGNRRRALARDKMESARVQARKSYDATSRDLANRMQGLRAEASGMIAKANTKMKEMNQKMSEQRNASSQGHTANQANSADLTASIDQPVPPQGMTH